MKTKNFNGNRLRSARLYRGKSIDQVSKEININSKDLMKFESEEDTPKLDTVLSLSNILNFPRDYFYEVDDEEILIKNTYFSSQSFIHTKDELSQKMMMVHKVYLFFEKYLTLPQNNMIDTKNIVYKIEEASTKLRQHWDLQDRTIGNLVNIMEVNGFIISNINEGRGNASTFSQKQETLNKERYFIILGNDKKSLSKRNYEIARQLGHIMLHKRYEDLNNLDKEELKHIEREADEFAREFLLPKSSFSKDMVYPNELEYYAALTRKWIVPVEVIILRAHELGIINQKKYQYLMKEAQNLGWMKKEPVKIKAPNPVLLKQATELLIDKKIMSGSFMVNNLGMSVYPEDIENLLGLKKGTLGDNEKSNSNVTVLNFKK